uniref:LRRNT domain-containing protein n=1 Tax=Lepeophtheirus salmonis TaxID=72036 RepID=A0A0K2VAR6_LEPSM
MLGKDLRFPNPFGILLIFVFFSSFINPITCINFCPEKCNCDDEKLVVTCIRADLMYMPNTLNPGLRTIVYKYNRFPTVDVSLK